MVIKDKTNEYLRNPTEQVGRAQRQGQVCSTISYKYWFKASRSCRDSRRELCIINRKGLGPIRATEKPASLSPEQALTTATPKSEECLIEELITGGTG